MRIIIILLMISFISNPIFSQESSKQELQNMAKELSNQIPDLEKQIAEAKKNKEDPETIKDLEDQLAAVKKQLAMITGVGKGISKMSEQTIQQASQQQTISNTIPKIDVTRISMIPE